MTIDILPTVAGLIGAKLPDHKIDGRDIWPLMAGEDGAESPHEAYFMYYGKQLQAVRSGKWKLHFPHGYRTMAGKPGGREGIPADYSQAKIGKELFDLDADIGETTDVASKHPEIVERLSALADAMRKDLGDNGVEGSGLRPAGKR
jgi:arylsulfatase A